MNRYTITIQSREALPVHGAFEDRECYRQEFTDLDVPAVVKFLNTLPPPLAKPKPRATRKDAGTKRVPKDTAVEGALL